MINTALLVLGTLFFFHQKAFSQSLKIESEEKLPKKLVRSLFKIKPDSNQITKKNFGAYQELLENHNFLFARVQLIDSTVHIFPNSVFSFDVDHVNVNGIHNKEYTLQLSKIKTFKELKQKLKSLQYNHLSKGFPFVQHSVEHNIKDSAHIYFTIELQTGERIFLEQLFIYSQSLKNKKLIKPLIGYKKGMPFDQSFIDNIPTQINASGFLRSPKAPIVFFSKNKCYLGIYAEKKKANRFDGIIGLLQNEENDLQITGFLKLKLVNTFQVGERISLDWTRSGDKFQQVRFASHFPYLFSSPWGTAFEFQLNQIDSTYTTSRIKPSVSYQIDSRQSFAVLYENESVRTTGLNSANTSGQSTLFGIRYLFKNIDFPQNPSKGLAFSSEFSIGTRTTDEPENKLKAYSSLEAFIPLPQKWTLKLSSRNAFLWHSSEQYLEAERYQLGGFYSLRGFLENEFLTQWYSANTIELRYRFERASNFNIFADQAFWQTDTNSNLNIPWGFGAGLTLSTRAGQLSVSYAIGMRPNEAFSISNGKLHFGYINHF